MNAALKVVGSPVTPTAPALRERRDQQAQKARQAQQAWEAAKDAYSRAVGEALDGTKADVAALRAERNRLAGEYEDASAGLRKLEERLTQAEAADKAAVRTAKLDEIAKRAAALNARAEKVQVHLEAGHVELHAIAREMGALFDLTFPGGPSTATRDLHLAGSYLLDGTTNGACIREITARVRKFTNQL